MNVIIKMSDAWQLVNEWSQFQTFFDFIFTEYSAVMTELLLPLSSVLPSALYLGIDKVVQGIIDLTPIGDVPFIAVFVGQVVGLVLALHILKLVFEALPIL